MDSEDMWNPRYEPLNQPQPVCALYSCGTVWE